MKIIVCLDDREGMMFNRRRQSRDRVLIEDVLASMDGGRLCMAEYSSSLFSACETPILVREDFLDVAEEGDTCFVENRTLSAYVEKIQAITVYRWNRHYPADFYFDLKPESMGFRLVEQREFAGYSHEKITKEVYVK